MFIYSFEIYSKRKMGINMSKQKNGEQVFEYKIPELLDYNFEIATRFDDYEILQLLTATAFSLILKV